MFSMRVKNSVDTDQMVLSRILQCLQKDIIYIRVQEENIRSYNGISF